MLAAALLSACLGAAPTEAAPAGAVRAKAGGLARNDQDCWEADFGDGIVMVLIPSGPFTRGSDDGLDDERPVREVLLGPYWIAKFPTTVGQFRRFVEETGYVTDAERGWGSWQYTGRVPEDPEDDPWEPRKDGRWNNIYFEQGDDHPVGSVSWNDARAYAGWLSERIGVRFDLPTEAQWEKAARGIDARRYPWGDEPPSGSLANLADVNFMKKYVGARRPEPTIDDGYVETSPVDAFPAGRSPYGVFDLAGNLGEWCFDVYDDSYYAWGAGENPAGPLRDPDLPDERIDRVNRGGSWVDRSGHRTPVGGHNLRAAARTGDEQNSSDDHMGFRLAIDPAEREPEQRPDDR